MTPAEQVIEEAKTWIGTPFHFEARVKGAGVDCAQFIAAVFEDCGVFRAEEYGFFGRDWHLNTDKEHYKFRLVRHAAQLTAGEDPQPGYVALSKVGRVFSHAGIVIEWPLLVHACPSRGVCIARADVDPMWMGWDKAFFNPFSSQPNQKPKCKVVVT